MINNIKPWKEYTDYKEMSPHDVPLKLHEAIRFAEEKHRGQVRKGTDIAYIVHPMEVLQILMGEGCGIELAIAGVLHDVLEDTDCTREEIASRFGEEVLSIVEAHTEKKSEGGVERPWRVRKEEDLDSLRNSSKEVMQLVLADSISNLRSMVYDYSVVGDKLWDRFNANKEDIAWYYSEKIEVFGMLQNDPNVKYDYWEIDSLFKHLFVDFYVCGDEAIYQKSGEEAYVLKHDEEMLWLLADEIPEDAEKVQKNYAEKLEDYWRFRATVQDQEFNIYNELFNSLDGNIKDGALTLISKVKDEDSTFEKKYVFSDEETFKLLSTVGLEQFGEICRNYYTQGMEMFLAENHINYEIVTD